MSDVSKTQFEQLVESCSTPLPEHVGNWRRVDNLHPLLFAKMLYTYLPYIADSSSWITWANQLSDGSSLLLINSNYWILVDRIHYGHSAYIHGARWEDGRKKVKDDLRSLFKTLFVEYDLDRLYALLPPHAIDATRLLLNLGFTVHTTFPQDQSFDGKKVDMFLLSLPKP